MENGGLVVSVTTLNLLFVTLLYLPICLISYRWPYRRLSPAAKGLASAMLVAQVLVILLSLALETQSATDFETWLWDFHEEWNIPATLASVQLAMVGGVALLTSWHAKLRPAWQRLYAVAIGLVFIFWRWTNFSRCTRPFRIGKCVTLPWALSLYWQRWWWLCVRREAHGFGILVFSWAWA